MQKKSHKIYIAHIKSEFLCFLIFYLILFKLTKNEMKNSKNVQIFIFSLFFIQIDYFNCQTWPTFNLYTRNIPEGIINIKPSDLAKLKSF